MKNFVKISRASKPDLEDQAFVLFHWQQGTLTPSRYFMVIRMIQ